MYNVITIACFSFFGIIYISRYIKTGKAYNLLALVPIAGVIALDTPLQKYISKSTERFLMVFLLLTYIAVVVLSRRDSRHSEENKDSE